MTYELHIIGSNYLDQANMKRVPAREIHNISLTVRPIGDGLAFTFEGYNLGDSRISDVSGFPLPGRSFFTTLRVTR
jgi:hypothetical protein